ncbi:MAG: type IV-A pilus assembly ATPase PilB [Deltaproteobacteria bacterium RIFOXYA12_FULL_58_15]|nr:MAG: type IV-A pilus assembly ATPase PilB [Deltaproteobacteria bacterium RIFOXYA12_FULL_58_15]OGR10571.1 MAG: type IV-A pilus assembly ATPase PilB [Deltaproteobacteria bacterium RIFOXYB12_FULL_58_9]
MARLGELLVRENIISVDQLRQAQDEQKKGGGRLGASLVKMGMVEENDLLNFLSKQYHVPSINLDDFEIEADIIKLLNAEVVNKHQVIPVHRAGSSLVVAMADPSNIFAIDDVKFLTGYNVEVVVASETQIARAIERYFGTGSETSYDEVMSGFDEGEIGFGTDEESVNVLDLEKSAEDAPVVKLVNLMLVDAIKRGASDIHIEPYEKEFRVRYRIDGALYEVMKPPLKLRNAVLSRIKIMSSLDIAERRLPQDGRIKLKLGKGREMDFRVSVLPTLFGEKAVLRLLDKSNLQLDMTKLGFEQPALTAFQGGIHQPFGMVLVTGPTGSGKTTTLYSALSELNRSTENISTAEDPVEFNLFGINQVQMHEDIGLNFASTLRSLLRQDPDIIMVGEIRDFETAEIAIKAALTGHLVLSTLHTNDAPSTVQRLLNMGVESFLITAALNAIVAQRLARRICPECKAAIDVPKQALLDLQVPADKIGTFTCYKGTGCSNCSNTGFKGRVAVYEVMTASDPLKELILNGASAAELKSEAIRLGMKTLRQAVITKLIEGVTTLDEVSRTSGTD